MKFPRRQFLHLAAGVAALPAVSRVARAETYPSRPIRLVVPFPPGGAFDAIGRPFAEKMKPILGTMIVENVGGGGGSLGGAAAARARPDGYTILLGGTTLHVTEALLKNHPQYDPIKDLDPIANVAFAPFTIAVHPSVPVHTLNELVDYVRANPGRVSYGSVGVGSTNHLIGELFKMLTGNLDLIHVPYRGAGPALTDLISGQIPMIAGVSEQVLELHRSGKLRVLAVTSSTRITAAPEFPTVAENGFPGLTAQVSVGLLAPARTPKPIIKQIAQATRKALAERDYQQFLIEAGFQPAIDSNPEKFRRSLAGDIAQWQPVVNALGLKID
jgi:tripartite-type tricarboxylate transporter receptor subunit TctC